MPYGHIQLQHYLERPAHGISPHVVVTFSPDMTLSDLLRVVTYSCGITLRGLFRGFPYTMPYDHICVSSRATLRASLEAFPMYCGHIWP